MLKFYLFTKQVFSKLIFFKRDFLFLYRSFLSNIRAGKRVQSTFTLGCSIFSDFVFLLAPRPLTFDLWARFISTLNLTVSVLQDPPWAGWDTYKDHKTWDDTAPLNVVAKPTLIRAIEPLKNVLNVIWTADNTLEVAVWIPEGRVVIMFLRLSYLDNWY